MTNLFFHRCYIDVQFGLFNVGAVIASFQIRFQQDSYVRFHHTIQPDLDGACFYIGERRLDEQYFSSLSHFTTGD